METLFQAFYTIFIIVERKRNCLLHIRAFYLHDKRKCIGKLVGRQCANSQRDRIRLLQQPSMPSRFALPRFIINAAFVLGTVRIVKRARKDEAGKSAVVERKSCSVLATYFLVAFVVGNSSSRVPKLSVVVYNDSPNEQGASL